MNVKLFKHAVDYRAWVNTSMDIDVKSVVPFEEFLVVTYYRINPDPLM